MTATTASTATDRPAGYREVFAVREFRALLASYAFLLIGETARMLALAVLVYAETGSSLLAAVAYVAGFLPHVFGGAFLLAYLDRLPLRALMVGYDLVRMVATVALAWLTLPPLMMIALVFVPGIVGPLAGAARQALLPELLTGDAYILGRSVLTATSGATQILGLALGGAVLALAGPRGLLWAAAATCLMSALVVRLGVRDRVSTGAGAGTGRAAGGGAGPGRVGGSVVTRTWAVNRQLLGDRAIRGLLLAQWLPIALFVGAEGVIVPYVADLGAADAAGTLLAAAAAGMLVGDLVVGRWVSPSRRERLAPWLAASLAGPTLLFVLRPAVPVAAALLGLAALGMAYQLGLQRRFVDTVPVELRGQAFGLVGTGMMTLQGLAMAVAGGLAEVLSPATVIAIAGAASLAATLALWSHLQGRWV